MLDEDRKRRRFIQNYFDLAARRERVQQIRVRLFDTNSLRSIFVFCSLKLGIETTEISTEVSFVF